MVVSVTPHGVVEFKDENSNETFLISGQHVNHYYGEHTSKFEEVIKSAK